MKRKLLTFSIITLAFVIITSVFAFQAIFGSLSLFNFHQGTAGNKAETSSYTFRSTTTYQQGSNRNVNTNSYSANSGWFNGTIPRLFAQPTPFCGDNLCNAGEDLRGTAPGRRDTVQPG